MKENPRGGDQCQEKVKVQVRDDHPLVKRQGLVGSLVTAFSHESVDLVPEAELVS